MESNTSFEYFVPIGFLFIILAPGAIFVWLIRKVRRGLLTASEGIRYFLAFSLTPIALYLAVSPLSLAMNAISGFSPVGTSYGQSLLAVVTIGAANAIFLCGIFCMVARWYESQRRQDHWNE